MQFKQGQRQMLAGVAALLLVGAGFLQSQIDPLRHQPAIEGDRRNQSKVLQGVGNSAVPFEYLLGAFTGFRQVVAGMLWVRADSLFHSGNYDGILPLLRLITWLDPNWLDVYATGAWHLMYNFTDTDQRSDRRYLPNGMALLDEGIANNSTVYDMYAEAGWNEFDKIKDFDKAVEYYQGANEQKDADLTRAGHPLAHSLERAGRIDDSIAQWKKVAAQHKAILDDPKASEEAKGRNRMSYQSAMKNMELMEVRKVVRVRNTQPPIDLQFRGRITRIRPRVLEFSGQWNLVGAKLFDDGDTSSPEAVNPTLAKGILLEGPVDGARVTVILKDADYNPAPMKEFTFETKKEVTMMQDSLSTSKGKMARKGALYVLQPKLAGALDRPAEMNAVYGFNAEEGGETLGIPLDKALAGGAPISELGKKQLEAVAGMPFAQLKGNAAKIAELKGKNYRVATKDAYLLGKFKREIDMTKDPTMYPFIASDYIATMEFDPRSAPDMVQDRLGWMGQGLTDKKYLQVDPKTGLRKIHWEAKLTKEQISGQGRQVLVDK